MSKIDCFCCGIFVGILILTVIIVILNLYKHSIRPIEVYQGKTTLQITYEDSIPVDSVVVYKPEFRK